VASAPDDFLAACEEAVASDDPIMRRRRSDTMATESWEAKVADLGRWVRGAEARRRERHDDVLSGGAAAVAAEAIA
jgi:hypothetical protein